MPFYNIYDEKRNKTGAIFNNKTDNMRTLDEFSLNVVLWIKILDTVVLIKNDDDTFYGIETRLYEDETSISAVERMVFEMFSIEINRMDFRIVEIKKEKNDFLDFWVCENVQELNRLIHEDDRFIKVTLEELNSLSENNKLKRNLTKRDLDNIFGTIKVAEKNKFIIKSNLY